MTDFTKEEVLALADELNVIVANQPNPTIAHINSLVATRNIARAATALRALAKSMDAEPAGWITTATAKWLSDYEGSACAIQTAVHNKPIKSDGGVPFYLSSPASAPVEPVVIKALQRIAALTPNRANARTAKDLHLTVKAIAENALAEQPAPVEAVAAVPAGWVIAALLSLEAYEADLGERLPDDHELGRIDDSRGSPSFRIRVGHIRSLAAAPQPASQNGEER